MPRMMTSPTLALVPAGTPGSQRVAVLESIGKMRMAHAAIPVPLPHQVRVKITYVGICGSDLEVRAYASRACAALACATR